MGRGLLAALLVHCEPNAPTRFPRLGPTRGSAAGLTPCWVNLEALH